MALVPIRIDRTSKPPLGTPLRSDGHWSAKMLLICVAFNESAGTPFELLNSKQGVLSYGTGASSNWSAEGLNLNSNVATNANAKLELISLGAAKCINMATGTIFHLGKNLGQTSGDQGIIQSGDGGLTNRRWMLQTNISSSVYGFNFHCGGSYRAISGVTLPRLVTSSTAMSWEGGGATGNGYYNGIKGVSWTGGTDQSAATITTFPIQGNSEAQLTLSYGRRLTDIEIASLSANPWQIFEPEIVWVNVTSGASGTTYQVLLDLAASSSFSDSTLANLLTSCSLSTSSGFSDSATNQTSSSLSLSSTATLNNTVTASYIISLLLDASASMTDDYASNVGNLILNAVAGMQSSATKTSITNLVLNSTSSFSETSNNIANSSLGLNVTSDFSDSAYRLILASLQLDSISGFNNSVSSVISAIITIAANSDFSDSSNANILASSAIQAVANFATYNNVAGSAILSEIRMSAVLSKDINVIAVMEKVISLIAKPK